MKRTFIYILLIFILIIVALSITLVITKGKNRLLQEENAEYEFYTGKVIYGVDIVTLINKAVDNNEKYNVEQDENGFYINDNNYSIIIEVGLIELEEPVRMEKIHDAGTSNFIEFFNTNTFESVEIRYHENTGKISYIKFVQTEQI